MDPLSQTASIIREDDNFVRNILRTNSESSIAERALTLYPTEEILESPGCDSAGGETPARLRYHPFSKCKETEGYLGSLSATQSRALARLKESCIVVSPLASGLSCHKVDVSSLTSAGEDLDLCLLRFLRANGWDKDRTLVVLAENATWREKVGAARIRDSRPCEVLGCSESTLQHVIKNYYPHWHLGSDKQGRPVLMYAYGRFDTRSLLKKVTLDALLMYHVWEQENHARLLARCTENEGHIIETYSLILDFKDMGLGQVTGDLMALLRGMGNIDARYYPCRGGTTYIINTPPMFNIVWNGIKGFMEGGCMEAKIFRDEKAWRQGLLEDIDASQLPPELGGTGRPLAEVPFLTSSYTDMIRDIQGEASGVAPECTPFSGDNNPEVAPNRAEALEDFNDPPVMSRRSQRLSKYLVGLVDFEMTSFQTIRKAAMQSLKDKGGVVDGSKSMGGQRRSWAANLLFPDLAESSTKPMITTGSNGNIDPSSRDWIVNTVFGIPS